MAIFKLKAGLEEGALDCHGSPIEGGAYGSWAYQIQAPLGMDETGALETFKHDARDLVPDLR